MKEGSKTVTPVFPLRIRKQSWEMIDDYRAQHKRRAGVHLTRASALRMLIAEGVSAATHHSRTHCLHQLAIHAHEITS